MDASEKEIDAVLQRMRCCIEKENVTFVDPSDSENKERKKNLVFLQKYNVGCKERLNILRTLTTKNFSVELQDVNKVDPSFEKRLYVFGKSTVLEKKHDGKKKKVLIYIKVQFFTLKDSTDVALIISFHEAENTLRFKY